MANVSEIHGTLAWAGIVGMALVLTACGSTGGSIAGGHSASADGSIGATATAADIAVRDGEEWIAFQSLADQFDPAADQDGIEGDDTIFMVTNRWDRAPPASARGHGGLGDPADLVA